MLIWRHLTTSLSRVEHVPRQNHGPECSQRHPAWVLGASNDGACTAFLCSPVQALTVATVRIIIFFFFFWWGRGWVSPSLFYLWILSLVLPLWQGRVQYGLLSDLKHGKACKPLTRLDNASKLKGSMAQVEIWFKTAFLVYTNRYTC